MAVRRISAATSKLQCQRKPSAQSESNGFSFIWREREPTPEKQRVGEEYGICCRDPDHHCRGRLCFGSQIEGSTP
jgi:hypothetical protein